MQRKTLVPFLILVIATALAGCQKKAPQTHPDEMTTKTTSVAPPAQEVTASTTPPVADKTPDPLSQDLQSVNSYVQAQGLVGDVFFDFDKYELKADARDRLAKNAQWLNAHPEFTITIEGHCDERGTSEYNLALGDRRANAAKEYLVSLGVTTARLRTISYGKERPFCTEHSESCWSQNRRAHFLLTGRANAG
ncbi:MAG: peptidoglycan-associated lipoprotein Pal [Acidobacteriota bacterium]